MKDHRRNRTTLWKAALGGVLTTVMMLSGCKADLTDVEYIEQAKEYQDKGNLQASIIELKNALQKNPENPEARTLLGRIYIELGDGAAAEKELRRAVDLGVIKEGVSVPLARALLLQGKSEALLEEFPVVSTMSPDMQAELYFLRGKAFLLGLGNLDAATTQFQSALQAKEDSPHAWLGQAYLAFVKQEWEEAYNWLDRVLEATPKSIEALALRGDLAVAQSDFAEAEKVYQQAVDIRPQEPAYRLALAMAQINMGKLDEAIKHLDLALKAIPNHPQGNYLRALAAYQKQDFERAQLHAERALNVDPNHLKSLLIAGAAQYSLNSYERANLHLRRFVTEVPRHEPGRKLLAATQLKMGLAEEAAATLGPVITLSENDAELLTTIGSVLASRGNLHSSLEFFEKAASLQTDQAQAIARLGITRISMGEKEQGIEDLERAIGLDPKLEAAEAALIITHLNSGEYDKALEIAERLRAKHPGNPQPLNLIGITYLTKGDVSKAREAFNRALEIDSGHPVAVENLAMIHLHNGEIEKARALYQETLNHYPDNLQAMMRLGALEFGQGRTKEAKTWVERAIEANPQALEPRISLASYYLRFQQPLQALNLIEEIQDLYPDNPSLLALRGEAQFASGQMDAALDTFKKLLQLKPNWAEAHYLLAKTYGVLNDSQRSLEKLSKTLELDPDHVRAKAALTRRFLREQKLEKAENLLAELAQIYPQHPEVLALQGLLAIEQDRPQDAVVKFQEILTRVPSSKEATTYLAISQWQAGDKGGSIATLKEWLNANPTDVTAQFYLANNYLLLDRLEDAESAFARVLELAPDHVLSLNNLAWLLREKDSNQALEYAERAYALDPNSPIVMDTFGMLLLDRGETERALRLLERASQAQSSNPTIRYHWALALSRNGNQEEARRILNGILTGKDFESKQNAQSLLQSLGGKL